MLLLVTIIVFVAVVFFFKNKNKPLPETYPLIEKGELYEGARKLDDWYSVQQFDPQTFAISEYRSTEYNNVFLLLGSEKALLVDAGSGTRPKSNPHSVIDIAKQLTHLPIEVILTHFHSDHIGDIDQLDSFYMIDLPHLRKRAKDNVLKLKFWETLKTGTAPIRIHTWIADGDHIDLGERKIHIKHTPGHTPESICLFDKTLKYALLGDCLYTHPSGIVTFLPGGNELQLAYSWDKVLADIDNEYALLGSHGAPRNSWSWALKNKRLLDKIRDGKAAYRWDFFWPFPIPSRVFHEEDLKLSASLIRGLNLLHYPILAILVLAILTLAYGHS